MELVCLVKADHDRLGWQERIVRLQQREVIILTVSSVTEEFRLDQGCILSYSEESKTLVRAVAWPRICGKRRRVECLLETDEATIEQLKTFLESAQIVPKERKKLLVFVNPYAGTKKAKKVWSDVKYMIEHANIASDVVFTERANHARDMIKDANLEHYSGVVSVSGDGLLHEILNGLAARADWEEVRQKFPIGLAPGGSGNAVHCSLVFQLGEVFADEVAVAGLNIANGVSQPADFIECETKDRTFVSIFGIAWGFIPEADIGSEVIRWMGPSRAYLWVAWRMLFPVFYAGKVEYLEVTGDPEVDNIPVKLPKITDPVPEEWKAESGEFLNVYVCKQSWLDYAALLVPDCKLDDGFLWLVMTRGPVSRMEMMTWLMNVETAGHLLLKQTTMVKIRAFRLSPDTPADGGSCPMTVDAERFDEVLVQGRIRPRGCRIMTKQQL